MMKNERGTSTPSLLTRQTVSPWLLDKLHRDGKYRDSLPPVLRPVPCPSQTGTWALPTSHHGLQAPEGGEGSQALARTWLSWPCCPFSFQTVDCHKKVSHRHQEYRTDLRSICDTQPVTVTKQAWSGACLIFVARIVSTKNVRKRVDRQLRKAGFKFLVYHRVFVWPQWSCLFPARLSNISVGGAEEKYMKNQEVSGYTGVPKSSRLAYLYI